MSPTPASEFTSRLKALLDDERQTLVEFLLLLGEVDRERHYLQLGYPGSWEFVRRALGQTETMTHYRLTAARLLARFPQAVELLRGGQLCMTTLATLAPVLTEENCGVVLAEAMGKSKVEVQKIKAQLDPKPVPRDVVSRVLVPAQVEGEVRSLVPAQVTAPSTSALPPMRTETLTAELTRRHMTTDEEFEQLLRRARSALSHKMPGASELDILKAGLREVIRKDEKRKGLVDRPRAPKPRAEPPKGDDAIPADVKRKVWQRDGGCCQWPTAGGGVCGSIQRLEFHHLLDRGKGGTHTLSNIVIACRTHNALAADRTWGKQWMDQFRARSRTASREEPHRAPAAQPLYSPSNGWPSAAGARARPTPPASATIVST
jgi:5-methylcytosine-specific restriction endonuclease McrA